jgi:hypothetical protein
METYARAAMQEWMDKVRHRTEQDFVPWYCNYWTQQWLDVKAAWYQANHAEGGSTPAEQLAAYLEEQYEALVLEPVREEIDPDKVMDEAASAYVDTLRDDIQGLHDQYRLPPAQLHERLDHIPAIVPDTDRGKGTSLYQLLQSRDITRVPAYMVLVGSIRSAGGTVSFKPLNDRFVLVASSIAEKAQRRLAGRGAATAASAALGGVGMVLGIGVTMWSALEHAKALPALETEIRQQLRAGLDSVWSEASADLDNTVLGPVHHISSNIEVGLLFPQVD